MDEARASLEEFRETTGAFVVDDDAKATWAMRSLRAIAQKRAEIDRIAQSEIELIEAWANDEKQKFADKAEYFEGLLKRYAQECRENPQDGRKTIQLPYGKISSRKTPDKIAVADFEGFKKWATENDRLDLIRIKEEAAIADIKKAFPLGDSPEATMDGFVITPDGEIVNGLTAERGSITYSVEAEA